jgi:CBS domain-containing protein
MSRLVREIMQTNVVTVPPETSVRDLLRRMVASQISGVPVVSDEGVILGVVSTTDVIRLGAEAADPAPGSLTWEPLAVPGEEFDPDSAASFFMVSEDWSYPTEDQAQAVQEGFFDGYSVADIMTRAAFTVRPTDTVEEAARFLLRGRIHRALVVEGNQLTGIVTTFDLLRALVGE